MYILNGIEKWQLDTLKYKLKANAHIETEVVCAMAMLISIVLTGKVWEESSSLVKVCCLSFQFSHHGDARAPITAITETLPLYHQKGAKRPDMLTQYDRHRKQKSAVDVTQPQQVVSRPSTPRSSNGNKLASQIANLTSAYIDLHIKRNINGCSSCNAKRVVI